MTERRKLIEVVMVCLIIVGSMAGYYLGNNQGYQAGYAKGDESGYLKGNVFGYNTGVPVGYGFGYSNGTKDGYNKGYTAGDASGYSRGYGAGDFVGYNRGYTAGDSAGRVTGYANGFSIGKTTGYDLGEKAGYTSGYQKGWTATGFNIRDPTYHEMLVFISSDKTDENTYVDSSYVCHDFSFDVKRNAFNAGYRCFYVSIEMGIWGISEGHALVAFNTTDRGIIYVEPQSDRITKVQIGQPYLDRTIYVAPSYNDTVTKIELIP